MPLIIEIRVTPRSGRSVATLDTQGRLKAFLKSPPEQGKANKELVKLLSKKLSCPQSAITLVGGATFRIKQLKIDLNLSFDEFLTKLGLAIQTSLIP